MTHFEDNERFFFFLFVFFRNNSLFTNVLKWKTQTDTPPTSGRVWELQSFQNCCVNGKGNKYLCEEGIKHQTQQLVKVNRCFLSCFHFVHFYSWRQCDRVRLVMWFNSIWSHFYSSGGSLSNSRHEHSFPGFKSLISPAQYSWLLCF